MTRQKNEQSHLPSTKNNAISPDPRCERCFAPWGNQPSENDYTELVNVLAAIKQKRTQDELDACILALKAIWEYLERDPISRKFGFTRPIALTINALVDRRNGGNPPLLFKAQPKSGHPISLSEAALRAQVILMFEMLTEAGVSPEEASRWLSKKLRNARIMQKKTLANPQGEQIEAHQIRRWRGEKGGKSLKGTDASYAVLASKKRDRWPGSRKEAEARVQAMIHVLWTNGF